MLNKVKPTVIMASDSFGKHVNPRKFYGRTFIKRCPTFAETKEDISSWKINHMVEKVIVHNGINDVKNNSIDLYKSVNDCIDTIRVKFSNEDEEISQVVVSPNANIQLKNSVSTLNKELQSICRLKTYQNCGYRC